MKSKEAIELKRMWAKENLSEYEKDVQKQTKNLIKDLWEDCCIEETMNTLEMYYPLLRELCENVIKTQEEIRIYDNILDE